MISVRGDLVGVVVFDFSLEKAFPFFWLGNTAFVHAYNMHVSTCTCMSAQPHVCMSSHVYMDATSGVQSTRLDLIPNIAFSLLS